MMTTNALVKPGGPIDTVARSMTFESVAEVVALFEPIMHAIAAAVGPNCEIVVHDLTSRDLTHTVAAIVNGHVSGRKVGGPSTNLGIEVLKDDAVDHDEFGYLGQTADGRELRSSSVYFRNAAGLVIAAFCINFDLTPLQRVHSAVAELLPASEQTQQPRREFIATDIEGLLDGMIVDAFAAIGKPPAMLDKADRVKIVSILENRGVFQVKRAVDLIANRLGVSRVTLYAYLDEVHSGQPD